MPLADKIRPTELDRVFGQKHILGENRPLKKIIESGRIPNMIFYGPSGVGKTTVANIIAQKSNMELHKLNGTSASTADIKEIIASRNTFMSANGILLYLDEIQYLNKKQQQSLLEYIENGDITLIASTTENPFFYVYNAILSRCTVFEFKALAPEEIIPAVERGFMLALEQEAEKPEIEEGVYEQIARGCGGDVRKSLNTVELCMLSANEGKITCALAKELAQRSNMRYDRDGDQHYDLLSAFQKSIRGSDENAALHYLARLLEAGDLPSVCRRLLVTASEDVGLAYPNGIVIAKACVDAALQLGLPEARIPLAQAVVLLATSPKSNSAYNAINAAMADVQKGITGDFPRQLQNVHYDGEGAAVKGQHYLYPHDFPNHYVKQQYLPDELKDKVYYEFGDNKLERAAEEYRSKIKG
ncbi:MAG: replication-associated recombination protein A [Firmicutes bacterium]|nr:replication-associated recombination protein A [[Eubacterium] siraeum]MCM1488367.1 replication-associated recombination protein A [Bacillota bacterium]